MKNNILSVKFWIKLVVLLVSLLAWGALLFWTLLLCEFLAYYSKDLVRSFIRSSFFFLFGLPVFALIIQGFLNAFGIKRGGIFLRWCSKISLILGAISCLCLYYVQPNDWRRYEEGSVVALPLSGHPQDGRLKITVSKPAIIFEYGDSIDSDLGGVTQLPFVSIATDRSPDNNYWVTVKRFAAGWSSTGARLSANRVQYAFTYKEGILDLENGFSTPNERKYRLQNVEVLISIPVGKSVSFDESVCTKLNFKLLELYAHARDVWRPYTETSKAFKMCKWKTKTDYLMSDDGGLTEVVRPPQRRPQQELAPEGPGVISKPLLAFHLILDWN